MLPPRHIVAKPYCCVFLHPRITGACQHEWTPAGAQPGEPFVGCLTHEQTIQIAHFEVPHRTFGCLLQEFLFLLWWEVISIWWQYAPPSEEGRLIHVIPDAG